MQTQKLFDSFFLQTVSFGNRESEKQTARHTHIGGNEYSIIIVKCTAKMLCKQVTNIGLRSVIQFYMWHGGTCLV